MRPYVTASGIVLTASVLAIGTGMVGISPAQAASIVFSFSGGTQFAPSGFTYGFQFTPVVDITVDSLGYFDQGQDGLNTPHQVSIWNTAGTLLTSTSVNTANSTLQGAVVNGGQFRFTPITGSNLFAGNTYVFGALSSSTDTIYNRNTNISNAPSLATVSDIGYFSTSNSFPNSTIGNSYGAGSFTANQTTTTAVPEPFTIIGTLVGGSAALRMRKKLKAIAE